MKINVACECGSAFQAPEHLGGQTVKCPSCGKALTVPGAGPGGVSAGQAGGDTFDENDLSALDQSPLDASGVQSSVAGRTAMNAASSSGSVSGRSAAREAETEDAGVTQELDDRMTRLYEVYAGKKMQIRGKGSKLKLLIGLSIALLAIGAGVGVGWNIVKDQIPPVLESMANGTEAEEAHDRAVEAIKTQHPDAMAIWAPAAPSTTSAVALSGTQIVADTSDPSRFTFKALIVPASKSTDRRLSMSTAVVLYRALSADGEFTQADRVSVEDYDQATGSLTFELFDAELSDLNTNQLHYRLSGVDSGGNRLFDTPAAVFALITQPTVKLGRVAWEPKAADRPASAVRVQARLDAPGWDGVFLWQVTADSPINQLLPDLPSGLSVVVESAVYTPSGIDLDGQGQGGWQMAWIGTEVNRRGRPGVTVIGAAPYADAYGADYRLTPDDQSFTSVDRSQAPAGAGKPGSRTLSFTPEGGSAQTMTLAAPPKLLHVAATAYDGRVHLSWDNSALLAGLDRFDGPVGIAVRRVDDQGQVSLIAQLPVESQGYTDADLPNGRGVTYEVFLSQGGILGTVPMIHADAWVEGRGTLAVLAAYPASDDTAVVFPEASLDRLHVSLGISELSFPGTGLAAVQLLDRLSESLMQTPGLEVVDRRSLHAFYIADNAMTLEQSAAQVGGTSAQVHLRLVDSTTAKGPRLSLWATDLAGGGARLLAQASADQVTDQADLFITALTSYLHPRMPESLLTESAPGRAPRQVVVGPIYPVDQSALYYGTDRLTEQLAQAGDQAHDGTAFVTRRFWLDDTQVDPQAITRALLEDTLLITGRVWNTDSALPGVSLRAVDASTGHLIDRFVSERLNPEAMRGFVQWCGTLQASAEAVPVGGSALLNAEQALQPIHPVWREMASQAGGSSADTSLAGADVSDDAPKLSFGLPLPASLSGQDRVERRDASHPLCVLRPYIAPQPPLTFDRWVKVYADYLQADCAAFIAGFEQIRREQTAHPGPVTPHLIVRGEHRFTGTDTIPAAAGSYRVSPMVLNVRGFFPMGSTGRPMLDYRGALSVRFHASPWSSYHAWKQVKRGVAEPFIKGELFGVREGTYDRLEYPEKPAPLGAYTAAKLLANMGNSAAHAYQQKSRAVASKALDDLIERGGSGLTSDKLVWATDALLVLAFEKDSGAIQQLNNDSFRRRCLKVEPKAQTDVLRMLVDQIGPGVWDWADEFESIDWALFQWRSGEEAQRVMKAKPGLIPEESAQRLLAWAKQETQSQAEGQDVSTASGPGTAPSAP